VVDQGLGARANPTGAGGAQLQTKNKKLLIMVIVKETKKRNQRINAQFMSKTKVV
jgi:hypothetical protein